MRIKLSKSYFCISDKLYLVPVQSGEGRHGTDRVGHGHWSLWTRGCWSLRATSSRFFSTTPSTPHVWRGFGDIAGATILADIGFFAICYILMFAYTSYMLGKLNYVEQRVLLASAVRCPS